jgi:NADH-quinone oxidoreductase subunit L
MGSNYVVLFAGWEGVGLCSYLLIGFWFKNGSYNQAANKAFIMNRIGDLGFLLGIILIYLTFGSTSFDVVFSDARGFPDDSKTMIAITLLLFIGAIGKSAQLPLYTWLPDAMAGPTPVSALIHAATMVTAGIYMIVRSNVLYSLAPFTLQVIAVVGTATAIFAALIAVAQNDIKKVLAYSTVSQLGYMFAALGFGAYTSGMFHLTTHAFFKALLFLAAGSVIHGMSGEQDIRRMGGLRKKLPVTFAVFVIGTLAISGVPPFAGFFSKDEILANAWMHNKTLFTLLSVTSALTAFYMFRLLFLTFFGKFRGTHSTEHHLHESPPSMTVPLIILAILSTAGGFLGMPEIFSSTHLMNNFLSPAIMHTGDISHASHRFEWGLIIASVIVIPLVAWFAYRKYTSAYQPVATADSERRMFARVALQKFYVDEIYDAIIVRPLYGLSGFFWRIVEIKWIDGIVNSVSRGLTVSSSVIRLAQTGNVGFYIFIMVVGVIAMLVFKLLI